MIYLLSGVIFIPMLKNLSMEAKNLMALTQMTASLTRDRMLLVLLKTKLRSLRKNSLMLGCLVIYLSSSKLKDLLSRRQYSRVPYLLLCQDATLSELLQLVRERLLRSYCLLLCTSMIKPVLR